MVGDVMIYEVILTNGQKIEIEGKGYDVNYKNDGLVKIRGKHPLECYYSAIFNLSSIAGIIPIMEWGESDDSND
jgi:hypothetical protein